MIILLMLVNTQEGPGWFLSIPLRMYVRRNPSQKMRFIVVCEFLSLLWGRAFEVSKHDFKLELHQSKAETTLKNTLASHHSSYVASQLDHKTSKLYIAH